METNQKKPQQLFTRVAIPCKPNYSLLEKTYRKNQLIITFGKIPSDEEVKEVIGYFKEMGIKKIKVIKCNCNMPVQLWLAKDIHTVVSGNGVKAGTGPGTRTVGESYSLNFLSKIPRHHWGRKPYPYTNPSAKEEIVTIAVLDTGIDLSIVDEGYISNNFQNKPGYECFSDAVNGWNFVDDNGDINDDNPGRHGSLVTQFIIKGFENSAKSVKIIPLKTHDRNGNGDLFKIFCAIYYAIAKGAKIINASWGFYYYEEAPIKQLNALIATLKDEGILFITAAGNQSDAD
ncbi:MAG TPA: S8 family serine peptidase, partial [Mucilaginibacter sp.]|nr:S8 family serine peptidase [Mucilaginibacter sp.]